ncbi:hypothetical protein [Xanthomonas hortorum]|uniref:hypothetical protein n=1 Tax=Xanthomonas hortorum TaxID=56454 RepID=UPI001594BCD6|nr:hypothetical protein [Xanthomonas hortorum]NHF68431.1 hypothetical protein [Xanthomonas hortorum]
MKLIIKEFLSQLRESGELDRLLPDLLARMKIIPISRAQVGVRQNGVDIAAVGKDEHGVKTLFLFVLKVGDLGRRDWDGGVNAVRATLNQIQDSYLRSSVRSEHRDLPAKVVICSTGDLKQEVLQDYAGYVDGHAKERLSFEFWSGDRLADLIDAHLLDEYAIDPSERANLRRAIALIGSRDYDLRHAYKILQVLLLNSHDVATALNPSRRKFFIRQVKTAALMLEILFRWAREEGNLLNAFRVGERCCLWTWEAIRIRGLFKYGPAASAYWDIYQIHNRICEAYFNKLRPYFLVRDGLSGMARENALVTDKVFEQIGVLAEIGLVQLQSEEMNVDSKDDEDAATNATMVADVLAALIKNNPSSGSPRYDGNAIELSLAFMLLLATRRREAAKQWLEELANRVSFAFSTSKHFPVATDSFDDLVALEVGNLTEEQVEKLKDLSTLAPTLMYWSVVFGHDQVYQSLQAAQDRAFKGVCLQAWYADENTEALLYRQAAQYESGTTEAPIKFPADIGELIAVEKQKMESGTMVHMDAFSSVKRGMWVLVAVACRHYRMPFPSQLWIPFLVARLGAQTPDQGTTTA